MPEWRRHLLSDPQTSARLPVACAADKAAAICHEITAAGYRAACVIGHVAAGPAGVEVRSVIAGSD